MMKRMALLAAVLAVAVSSVALASSPAKTSAQPMPFTFLMTHYVLLGDDPNNPTGVRYESTGSRPPRPRTAPPSPCGWTGWVPGC